RANLVYLDQDRVGDAFEDPFAQKLDIRHEEVVPDELNFLPQSRGQLLPAIPIIFGASIPNRDDRETAAQYLVVIDQLFRRPFRAVGFLEDIDVLFRIEKFGGRRVERDENLLAEFVA